MLYSKEVEEALKNIKGDDPQSKTKTSKYRSYDEIKKDLDDVNLVPKTDAEVLQELLQEYEEAHTEKDKLQTLELVEYLVHQYDNGLEFVKIDGFKKIIYPNLNSTSTALKSEALKLLGSSMQNNPKIQIHAIETGAIDVLLRILSLEEDFSVKNRAVYAIGALLRGFPLAQSKFIENAGLSVFSKLFDTTNLKIQIKMITLLNDLLLEHVNVLEHFYNPQHEDKIEQYTKVNLKKKLVESNFCGFVSDLLNNLVQIDKTDYDSIEKTLQIIDTLSNCKFHESILKPLAIISNDLKDLSNDDDPYYHQIFHLSKKLLKMLSKARVEL